MKCNKVYVSVSALFDENGKMIPTEIKFADGRCIEIKRVKNAVRAASLRAGGQGVRYTCCLGRQDIYLFYEEPRWFIEQPV